MLALFMLCFGFTQQFEQNNKTLSDVDSFENVSMEEMLNSNIPLSKEKFTYLKDKTKYNFFIEDLSYRANYRNKGRVINIFEAVKSAGLLKNIPIKLLVYSNIIPTEKELAFLKDKTKYDQFMNELSKYAMTNSTRITTILEAIKSAGLLKELPTDIIVYSNTILTEKELAFLKDKTKYDQFMNELLNNPNHPNPLHYYGTENVAKTLEAISNAGLLNLTVKTLAYSNIIPTEKDLAFLKDKTKYDQFMEELGERLLHGTMNRERVSEILEVIRSTGLSKELPMELIVYSNIIPTEKELEFLKDKTKYDQFIELLTKYRDRGNGKPEYIVQILETVRNAKLLKNIPASLMMTITLNGKMKLTEKDLTFLKDKTNYDQFVGELLSIHNTTVTYSYNEANYNSFIIKRILETIKNAGLLKDLPEPLEEVLTKEAPSIELIPA